MNLTVDLCPVRMVPWVSKDTDCLEAELEHQPHMMEEVVTVEEVEEEQEEEPVCVTYLEELAVFSCQFVTSTLIHDREQEASLPWKLDTLCFQMLLLGLQLIFVGVRHIATSRKGANFRDHWSIISAVLCVLFLLIFVIMPLVHGISSMGTFVALYTGQILVRLLVRGTRMVISAPWRAHISDKTGLCLLTFVLMYVLAWLPTFLGSLYSYAQFTCICMIPKSEENDHLFSS